MVKICFKRVGKKKHPMYRIIVLDKRKDPWGDYLENLGTYDPHTKELNLKEDKIKEWMAKGAQPSDTIYNLLIEKGIIKGDKRRVSTLSKKRKGRLAKKETAVKEKEAAPKEEAPAEEKKEEKPADAPAEEKKEEVKPEEKPVEEKPVEEKKEEPAKEEAPKEEVKPEEPVKEEAK